MTTQTNSPVRGSGSLKGIIAIGVLTFLFLMLSSLALKKGLTPDESQRIANLRTQSDFQGERAHALAREIVAIGPRPAGSTEIDKVRDVLKNAARAAGLRMREEAWQQDGRACANLLIDIPGNQPGIILICTHLDSPVIPDIAYAAANDGAADAALLLELATTLKDRRHGRTLRFAWFDGFQSNPSGIGARHHLESVKVDGDFQNLSAVLSIRMVGDCYLNISATEGSDPALAEIFYDTAQRLTLRAYLHPAPLPVTLPGAGDPFHEAGVKVLTLVDPQYGGSILEHDKNFGGAGDSIDKVCPNSLQAVGDVVYHALAGIDGYLGRR